MKRVLLFSMLLSAILIGNAVSGVSASQFGDAHIDVDISFAQGKRNTEWYQFDSTDTYIYFTYSMDSCVDVYTIDGSYYCTIVLPDNPTGQICIKCSGNNTFISAKNNTMYVLDGIIIEKILSADEAIAMGYDYRWFQDKAGMRVDYEHISFLNKNGEVVRQIDTPQIIRSTMPFTNLPVSDIVMKCAAVAVIVTVVSLFIYLLYRCIF